MNSTITIARIHKFSVDLKPNNHFQEAAIFRPANLSLVARFLAPNSSLRTDCLRLHRHFARQDGVTMVLGDDYFNMFLIYLAWVLIRLIS